MIRFRPTILIILITAAVIGIYSVQKRHALNPVDLAAIPYEEKTPYWEERIRDVGAERAYEEFKASIDSVPPVERHWELHLFGNALYDVGGLNQIATCDFSFDNACFHSFMISSIEEFGVEASPRLRDTCVNLLHQRASSCLHGLGHALLGVYGYSDEGLAKSLKVCDENPDPNPLTVMYGCANGAFMEYNSPMDISGYEPRQYTEETAFEPCQSLENREHRRACTFAQLYWWFSSLKHEAPTERLAHIGKLCRGLNEGDTEMYLVCMQGAGNSLDTTIDYDPSKAADACAIIDPDPTARRYCQRHAAIRFSFYSSLENALRACESSSEEVTTMCRSDIEKLIKYPK